ncbi:CAP domain-containing protein [Panacibacter sp. DH6]|uniref:CAP domain-containing protein n=1 Tax=Panacibacter microcysteis TaxID=2793269 RepID=A0A931EB63_9BACT|nr:CAP domain-containing protein [Panacibacter microcysteis]MBG9377251.1 CAP domain-containing protein [Panacibacter microcysteis]
MNTSLFSKISGTALLVLFAVTATFPACAQRRVASSVTSQTSTVDIKALQHDILALVNKHRASLGLKALQMNEVASAEATRHSADMAKGKVGFGHGGFSQRMQSLNKQLGGLRATAENVAYGKIGAAEVMDMWLESSGHRKNIEGNFSMMGIGIAQSRDGYLYFTQIFMLK